MTRRSRGDLGQLSLAVLEAAQGPMTPSQVHEVLDADLAYTTVMARLHDKGVLSRQRAATRS